MYLTKNLENEKVFGYSNLMKIDKFTKLCNMNRLKQLKQFIFVIVVFTLSAITLSHSATSHGGRFNRLNFDIHIGYPGYYGFGYHDPLYYSPAYYPPPMLPIAPVVVAPPAPPVYVQQYIEQQQSDDWYYCQEQNGYYPYIRQCPGGWLRVAPQPTSK